MELLYPRCCGLDVHKKSITACVLLAEGKKRQKILRRFGTMTAELRELAALAATFCVTHVAMESTGVYWKPIWNVLEGQFELLLVNAAHIKNVPGRKTDMKDCEWIAQLLQHGLDARELRSRPDYSRVARSEPATRGADRRTESSG